MDLAKYQDLTGKIISDSDSSRYRAVIRRTTSMLESVLGYSLSSDKNLDKEEVGKTSYDGLYPVYPYSLTDLLPPDEVEGSYRLFPYNVNDIYIKTDPYQNVYNVKLVQPINDDEFVTFSDLPDYTMKNTGKYGNYIQKQAGWFLWSWYPWLIKNIGQDNGLLIAVDADWLSYDCLPEDLAYLWTDMIDYYSSDDISVTGNIKSESVNGHSWSYGNAGGGKGIDLAPHQSAAGLTTIAKYVGPNGTGVNRVLTI